MRIEDQPNLPGPSPIERLSLRHAARPEPATEARPAPQQPRRICDTLDTGQCRVWLNEAQREIDRLRRGLDVRPVQAFTIIENRDAPAPAGVDPAAPPRQAKLYAVDPLGQVPEPSPAPPTAAAQLPPMIRVMNQYHITNLGTLLDVLT